MSLFREAGKDGAKGPVSMRRVGAAALFVAGIAAGLAAVIMRQSWQTVSAAFGVPCSLGVFLLFFTTWSDISVVIGAYKGAK